MLICIIIGALNWATGETVAVKEIQLSNIPKAELGEIMVSDPNGGCLAISYSASPRLIYSRT